MILGRIAFGIIMLVSFCLLMFGIMSYGEGCYNGHDIPDWLYIIGCAFFPIYVTVSACLILMHFGLL